MTITDTNPVVERTLSANPDEQALFDEKVLFEEARRIRRRRWRIGITSACVVAVASACGLAEGGVFDVGGGYTANSSGTESSLSGATVSSAHGCRTGSDCVYVTNGTGIIPIGLDRYRISKPIGPATHGLIGFQLTVTPSAGMAYVWNGTGLTRFNLHTDRYEHPIPLRIAKGEQADSWVLAPSGEYFYLEVSSTGREKHSSLEEFNLNSRKMERSIPLPPINRLLAISPDGATAYVTTDYGSDLVAVNLASGSMGTPIVPQYVYTKKTDKTFPTGIHDLAISANGDMAYASTNTGGLGIIPIDLMTGQAMTPIPMAHAPTSIVLSPNGETAYVTGNGSTGPHARPAVMVLNLVTGKVTKSIRLPEGANGIAIAHQP